MAEAAPKKHTEALYRTPTVPPPSTAQLTDIAKRLNYTLSKEEIEECHSMMTDALQAFTRLNHLVEPTLDVKYPRTPGYRPAAEDNKYNAWYWKTNIVGATSGKLFGKKIAVKDNIMVAGVPMANGCRALEGMIPEVDATVITRVLDAGGIIEGKSVCESLCFSACSFTTGFGPVLNPNDTTRSSGGSSSGNAVLVTTGEVDMAIGGDQGGSIRLPSCWTGCVGLKPTWGLVPHTGVLGMETTVDHVGPMARTVYDCALMLEVLAGYDNGLDHRQPPNIEVHEYSKEMEVDNLEGINVGILQEGFAQKVSEVAVDNIVREAAQKLSSVGANVDNVSIPLYENSNDIWWSIFLEGTYLYMHRGSNQGIGHKGFYSSANMKLSGAAMKHDTKHLSTSCKFAMMTGAYLNEEFHGQYYARGQNLGRMLCKAIALVKYDVLIVPTIPFVAQKLPTATHMGFTDVMNHSQSMNSNTMPFNVTGHPALSINAGWINKLPVGMMIIGRQWDETMVLKVARAHEKLMAA